MRTWASFSAGLRSSLLVPATGGNIPTHCSASSLTRDFVCQRDVLRTLARGTPHETIQHGYHHGRRLNNRVPRRTFSSTSATRIRLEDDEDEELELPQNGRASKRPVRRPPPGPPKDLRSIILSREPKPRKPKPVDPEKVREIEAKVQMLREIEAEVQMLREIVAKVQMLREIEAKVQMLPDPRQLVNKFLDSRYIDLEDQITRALCTTRGIFCSHIEGLSSLVLCSQVACRRIELQYCKFVYRDTPEWMAAISDIENAVTQLRYEFVTGRIEYSQLLIRRMRELLEREYLNPQQSARAKVDKLLHDTEEMREKYRFLQSLGMAVKTGLSAIKSLIIPLKVVDDEGPDLPGLGFQDFQKNVLEAHKQGFSMAAHKHRHAWKTRVQPTTLAESQLWSAKGLTSSLIESMAEHSPRKILSLMFSVGLLQGDDEALRESARAFFSFHKTQTLVANRLRKSYTKKWSGVKPANSPELDKVWRQLDVMALFETQQALDMWLHYEIWILRNSLEGKFGPMWPDLDSGTRLQFQKNLHEFSVKFTRSRNMFTAELEMYRLVNWARLNVEEKLHKLGEPNDIQERGLFMVLKPLSQDHSRFNHWANQFVAISFRNWNLDKILEFSKETEESAQSHYVRLTEDYLEQMNRPSSFVPEIGTTEIGDSRSQRKKEINVKRPLFPMLNKMGLSEASIAPEALPLPSDDAAKSTSSSALSSSSPQALNFTRPKPCPNNSPPTSDTNNPITVKATPSAGDGKESIPKRGIKASKRNGSRMLRRATGRESQVKSLELSTFGDEMADSSANLSPSRPEEEKTVQHLENRPLIEQSSKNPLENLRMEFLMELPAETSVGCNPANTHKKQSSQQHGQQRHVKQSAKELTDIIPPRPLKPPKAQQHKSRSKPRLEPSQKLPVKETTAISKPAGSKEKNNTSPPASRAKSSRSVRQSSVKEVSTTSKPAGPTKKNAVAPAAFKEKSRRPVQRPSLTKRQRQTALGSSRNSHLGRDVQRKIDLDFLSGQSGGIRPYSTSAQFSEAKTNESGVGCIDEQMLPLGASSTGETVDSSEETVKDGASLLFWTHSSQRGPDGQKLIVHYCRTLDSTEEVARLFLDSKVIGFDMEWKAQASAWDSIQSNLSLIQVANEERIALFQIALFKPGQTLKDLVAPSLKQLLESPNITKVGVSIKADATRLRKYLGVEARSIFELSHLFKLVKYGLTQPKLVNKRAVNLSDQAEEHLGLPLEKSEDVRCGDWTRPLNYRQVQYAATDPYACICLFNIMDQKRQAMDFVPPLPAHADLNLPIVLPPRDKEPIASSPVNDSEDADINRS